MNIKKLIREEMEDDGLDWIREVKPEGYIFYSTRSRYLLDFNQTLEWIELNMPDVRWPLGAKPTRHNLTVNKIQYLIVKDNKVRYNSLNMPTYGSFIKQGYQLINIDELPILKESDDGLEWIRETNMTLLDLFNSGSLKTGDKLVLRGYLVDGLETKSTYTDDFTITIGQVGDNIIHSTFLIDESEKEAINNMDITSITYEIGFMESDADLLVIKYEPT